MKGFDPGEGTGLNKAATGVGKLFTKAKAKVKNYITDKKLEGFEKHRSNKLNEKYVPASKKSKSPLKKNKKGSALKYTPQSQRGKVDSDKVYEVDREGGKKSGWKYKIKDGKWHASDDKRTGGKYVSIEDDKKFKSSVEKMDKLHPDAKGDKWSRKKKKRSEMFADAYTPQSQKKTEKSPMTLIELEQTKEYQDSDPRRRDLMKERIGISNDSQKVMNDPSIDPKRKKLILKSLEKADIEIQNQMQK